MPDSLPKFGVFRQISDGYRWRSVSAIGETVGLSEGGHPRKDKRVREVRGLVAARYPRARLRDATEG